MRRSLVPLTFGLVLLTGSIWAHPSGAATPLAAGAYRTKVNAICKAGIAKINAVKAPTVPSGFAAYLQTEGELGARLMKQIIEVTPPKSLQPAVMSALKLQGQSVDEVLALALKVKKASDPAAVLTAATPALEKTTAGADAAWTKAGLTGCTG